MATLREATRRAHDALEDLRFGRALADGTTSREQYVEYLQALGVLYGELERAPLPGVAGTVWQPTMRRAHLVRQDLEVLGAPALPEQLTGAGVHAVVTAQRLRCERTTEPARLVGTLYVLQGSGLGGALLARSMGAALGLDGAGVATLTGDGARRGERWKAFGARVDAVGPELHGAVVEGARAMFRDFSVLFRLLDLGRDAAADAVNPEAGSHEITCDPVELRAALRAGERSMRAYPYLRARYGERGVRFTRSDSAWLVALSRHTDTHVVRQVRWLGVVLASRGMPRVVLETHLTRLFETLVEAAGAHARYARLAAAATELRRERLLVLPAEAVAELAHHFEARAPESEREALPGVDELLASAVADEGNGIRNAVSSLSAWLEDPGRFSAGWRGAVGSTVALARKRRRALRQPVRGPMGHRES